MLLNSLSNYHFNVKNVPFVISSVQFSHSVVTLCNLMNRRHARHPCPSPTPGVYSNSCPLSGWCHPAISSSVVPFSSCPQSLPTSGSFPVSQLFTSGGPKYWSFSFTISPSNEHPGLISFRMDFLDLLANISRAKISTWEHSAFKQVIKLAPWHLKTSLK